MDSLVSMSEIKTIGEAIDVLLSRFDEQIAKCEEIIVLATAERDRAVAGREAVRSLKASASENNWITRAVPPDAIALINSYPLGSPPKPEPLWKTIERTMRGRDRFTGAEAVEAVARELGRSLGKNRHQTVRNNLIRKPDVFRQNEDSSWTVISNEKEAPKQATS